MATDEPSAALGVPTAYENGAIINAKEFFADGLKQLQAGAFQDALDALSIAIQLDPNFGEAFAYRQPHGHKHSQRCLVFFYQVHPTQRNFKRTLV
jgi:hypothetical protein